MSESNVEIAQLANKVVKKVKRKPAQSQGKSNGDGVVKKKVATAYHMFLKERLPRLKVESPNLNPKDYLSTVCAVWRTLTEDDRGVYNEQARIENERQASNAKYVETQKQNGEKELQIPIFTQAFISHNREREKEFRRLQKSASEVQQQSALLSAHSDSLRTAINRLENEMAAQRSRSTISSKKLETARSVVTQTLVDIARNITEDDSVSSGEVFKAFSTADLLSNLKTTFATAFADMDEEQRDYVKLKLIGIMDCLAAEDIDRVSPTISD